MKNQKSVLQNSKATLFILPILTTLISFSANAFERADFSGHWVADSGSVSSNVGLSSKCSKIEITIEQNATALITKKYEASCGFYGSTWGPIQQDLQGDQVLEAGEVVGKFTDDTMITVSQDSGTEYAYNLKSVKNSSGETVLQTYYGVRNGTGAIVIEGILHRVSN